MLENIGKDQGEHPEDLSCKFFKILNLGSISFMTHEMETLYCIWDQYLRENMKCEFQILDEMNLNL